MNIVKYAIATLAIVAIMMTTSVPNSSAKSITSPSNHYQITSEDKLGEGTLWCFPDSRGGVTCVLVA